ncbi:C4-dicarboxylate transporter DcuC [Paenibacillus apiarius]|uniref:C4-dicarboxylate transporter DcuC n=1 Tax=Paenibacillus apiarius TaxID=46240 RepID=UPI003B3B04F5
MLEIIISLVLLVATGFLIAKNYDAKFVLLTAGIVIMIAAVLLGHPVLKPEESTGLVLLDPFKQIGLIFVKQLGGVGLTIMVLFGFSSYMTHIGASDVAVHLLTKPLGRIKSQYILVPIVFLLGNLLSLVVPSASSLAVLLMATLYPVLKNTGMSSLTAGAIIATTATIMPTPLGADSVVAAENLGINLVEYVFSYHAKISIPVLLIMAVVHYFWQKYMDKRQQGTLRHEINDEKLVVKNDLPPAYYGLLPILPLILVLLFGLIITSVKLGLVEITFICMAIALIIEIIRKGSFKETSKQLSIFFTGMGTGLAQVVSLLVAAGMLVEGLKSMGIIDMLIESVRHIEGAGVILMLTFAGVEGLITFISGSGLAVFYSVINIIPEIAEKLGINGVMIALPMQLIANLVRSISPVAAVIIVVASIIKVNPIQIVKRTSVPILVGIVSCFILSFIFFT